MQKNGNEKSELQTLNEKLQLLEDRLVRVEKALKEPYRTRARSTESRGKESGEDIDFQFSFQSKGSVERSFGEFGMAWLGNIVLLFGITFLVQYLQSQGYAFFSSVAGYVSVAAIYTAAWFTRETYAYLSKLFYYNGHLVLFYVTLHLHYLQSEPLIKNSSLGFLILFAVTLVLLWISYKKKSRFMSGMALLMMLTAGTISNSTHYMLGVSALAAVFSFILYFRLGWIKVVIFSISFIYFLHLNWLFGNPFVSGELLLRETHDFGFVYLIITGVVFSFLAIIPLKDKISGDIIIASLIWNGLGFTSILLITVFNYFNDNYVIIFSIIAFFCILFSILFKLRSTIKITASIYALYAFLALSIAIYGIFLFPKAYSLLSIQSFLVISMALWFRSRFIVVMNTLLFLVLMIAYIKAPVEINSANFSFMFVAFISARVMNWKKERLNLKTELLRNLYLLAGFSMTLIAFHNAFPQSWITVSWMSAALLFFLLGYFLKNVKYRWMAIATMIASAINLLVVDMSEMNIGFRVLISLVLAITSIIISILYAKYYLGKTS